MENLEMFKKTPTIELIKAISDAERLGLQDYVNICAYELACRIYVPNASISFVKLLYDFGYKPLKELEQVEEQVRKLQ